MNELGASAWVWLELLEGTWGSAAPDVVDPEHWISWLLEKKGWLGGSTRPG